MSRRRIVILGGLVAAAGLTMTTSPAPVTDINAQCRSFLGSRNDGICIDPPDAPAPQFPPVGIGSTDTGGPGLTTGPLLPGQSFEGTAPIG
ncbi:MAG: hypothetical protein QOH60_2441 [Mycobacterium sp.]|jgi:hypothetical protein|nr:hypothetical protein [Mycobacterium sp.]